VALAEVPEQALLILGVQRAHPAVPVREVQRKVLGGVPAGAQCSTAQRSTGQQIVVPSTGAVRSVCLSICSAQLDVLQEYLQCTA
jgi:hypothetical protein